MAASLLLILVALVAVTAGAELLVRGAVDAARRLGVSSFFIGLTIVGFGTSMPELGASVVAALGGHEDIAVGNVVGSNIFNIAFILGLTAIVCPIAVRVELVLREGRLLVAAAALPWLALLAGGRLERWTSAVLLAGLGAYVWRGYRLGRATPEPAEERALEGDVAGPRPLRPTVDVLLVLLGVVLLAGGSSLFVTAASTLARRLGLSELVIGLTVVSAGTSLPELITSLVAAARRHVDVAVGNIVGSNIFNVLGILGVTALIRPQAVHPQVLRFDTPVMVLVSVALLPLMHSEARLSRLEGAGLVAAYVVYVTLLATVAPRWFG